MQKLKRGPELDGKRTYQRTVCGVRSLKIARAWCKRFESEGALATFKRDEKTRVYHVYSTSPPKISEPVQPEPVPTIIFEGTQ